MSVLLDCSYEREMLPRVKAVNVHGIDRSSIESKEKYLYIPKFKPLWEKQVRHMSSALTLTLKKCDYLITRLP